MEEKLPYRILLAATIVVAGLTVLYNTVERDRYASVLRYQYPVVEQPAAQVSDMERVFPEEENDPELGEASGDLTVTRVEFPLDVNTATMEQLQFIPQVGNVMSRRIVQYREHLGGYTDLEQLREIKGVGDKTYEHLYAYLIIRPEDAAPADPEAEEGLEDAGVSDEES